MPTYGSYTSDKVKEIAAEIIGHGVNASSLLGFYGTTPIAQRAGAAQASFTITIGTSQTSWGFAASDQFNNFVLQLREIQATLSALGLWKGAA
jgi:hypothetical protein